MRGDLWALHTQGLLKPTHKHCDSIYQLCGHCTTKLGLTTTVFVSLGGVGQGFLNIRFLLQLPRPISDTHTPWQAPANLASEIKSGFWGTGFWLCSIKVLEKPRNLSSTAWNTASNIKDQVYFLRARLGPCLCKQIVWQSQKHSKKPSAHQNHKNKAKPYLSAQILQIRPISVPSALFLTPIPSSQQTLLTPVTQLRVFHAEFCFIWRVWKRDGWKPGLPWFILDCLADALFGAWGAAGTYPNSQLLPWDRRHFTPPKLPDVFLCCF